MIGTDFEPQIDGPTAFGVEDRNCLRILNFVKDMPDLQREIVEGRVERDETFREIGLRVHMSEEATRKAFHRAIDQVRVLCRAVIHLNDSASAG